MNGPVKHVAALDYLRGIAVLAVLSFHTLGATYGYDLLPWDGWHRGFSVPDSFLYFLPISIGMMGVPVFFVISGFCIHMSFHRQGREWGGFFIRRIFRIYPPYLAALIFFAILYRYHYQLAWLGWEFWRQSLAHIFLVHNYPAGTIGSINGSFWSMAVEFQLYLLYPVLLLLTNRAGWRRTMIILAIIETAIRATEGLMETLGVENSFGRRLAWIFSVSPLGYWFSWAIGAFIAEAHLKNEPLPFLRSPLSLWAVLALISYFILPFFEFRFLLFALMTAGVVSRWLASNRLEDKTTRTPWSFIRLAGLWSYSIYLLHQPLLTIYYRVADRIMPDASRPAPMVFVFTLAAWVVIIAFSFLWYEVFEVPGIAIGKRIIFRLGQRRAKDGGSTGFYADHKTIFANRNLGWLAGGVMLLVAGSLLAGFKLIALDPAASNNLAWKLATDPEPKNRNGIRAVQLAEAACQQTQYKETMLVGTLAAAYAEAGRFAEAMETAQMACALAAQHGETNLLRSNQQLLELYRNHKSYGGGQRAAGNPP